MRIDVVTIFPEMFEVPLKVSLLGKAIEDGLLDVNVHNLRDFTNDRHNSVDDTPYGGGPGMVMTCGPFFDAVESLREANSLERVVLMSPRGRPFTQEVARELAEQPDCVLLCARYEGVDERISETLVTDEISVGDYVLCGGELPALTVIEAVSRMIPGVVGDWDSVTTDSFYDGILGPPQYTRPPEFRGMEVPAVLQEGHHARIAQWRRVEALRRTKRWRPDLLNNLNEADQKLLDELDRDQPGTKE